jgi:hypothetical protein
MGTKGPTITGSAAIHAERIKARDAERAAGTKERDGRQTAEIYGERAAAGYRADEELREAARLGELRARGIITPDPEPETAVEEDDEGTDEYEEDEVVEEDDEPTSTAERYARRERERIKAERVANRRAWAGASWTLGEQAGRLVR